MKTFVSDSFISSHFPNHTPNKYHEVPCFLTSNTPVEIESARPWTCRGESRSSARCEANRWAILRHISIYSNKTLYQLVVSVAYYTDTSLQTTVSNWKEGRHKKHMRGVMWQNRKDKQLQRDVKLSSKHYTYIAVNYINTLRRQINQDVSFWMPE